MTFENLLRDVIDQGLCLGCGTCVAACPSVLKMSINKNGEYTPFIEKKSCTMCGLCYKVCPGHFIPIDRVGVFASDKDTATQKSLLGPFIGTYIAFSADLNMRNSSTSGGIVSSILTFMLKKKLVEGALVAEIEKKTWKSKAIIATTSNEIYASRLSKYVVIPTNSLLHEIEEVEGKIAFVGLPCQIHGLENLSYYTPSKIDPKIALRIGLFCGSNLRTNALGFLLKKIGINDYDAIKEIQYRGGKYPGGFLVKMIDGKSFFIKKYYFDLLRFLYGLPRCTLCPDLTNELADISVGDAFLIDQNKPIGTLIVRTKKGESTIRAAVDAGYIRIYKISPSQIIQSNLALFLSKKKGIHVRMDIRERRGFKNPVYPSTCNIFQPNVSQIFYEIVQSFLKGKIFSCLLRNLPLRLSLLLTRFMSFVLCSLLPLIY
jgi:coenzyme F420 hydrogenase subunit beta